MGKCGGNVHITTEMADNMGGFLLCSGSYRAARWQLLCGLAMAFCSGIQDLRMRVGVSLICAHGSEMDRSSILIVLVSATSGY